MPEIKIGRYTIEEEIGRGGMGHVYKGYDDRFDRYVAVKVMPEAVAQEEAFRQRFEREAKIIATLQHPGIVPVHDFGEDNGQLYLVMRYMDGGSLCDRLTGDPLPIKEIAKVMHNVCHALASAHQKGIVHRDLKPGNILFDQYGHAFLADFGIAQLTNATIKLTDTNSTLGTPAYMSPEQVRADIPVDHRSDIYSLGIIFYEMIIGTVPYEAETPTKTMLMHILQPVPSIIAIRPELPYRCEQILQAVLAKERMDRYDSAVEFAHDIRQLAQGRPSGRPTSRPFNPAAASTAATVVLNSNGQTIDESFIESQILRSGNDLIDDVLSYQSMNQQQRLAERAQQIRAVRRREEAALQERQKQQEGEAARLRAAQQAHRKKQQQQGYLLMGFLAVVVLLAIAVGLIILYS